ncbi:MAG: type II toxin-antitoxin system HicA family toxin [Patescibacteria group bacterium]|nr:type II toxin-antitoxin system HicA family toxin [Patescibacteria group bacterium]
MFKLKKLSGKEIIKILEVFGFEVVGQKGSHIKLKKQSIENGTKQVMTIPNHKEMDKGTLKAIYNQATRYIAEENLRGYFFEE